MIHECFVDCTSTDGRVTRFLIGWRFHSAKKRVPNPALKRIYPVRLFEADLIVMRCTKNNYVTCLSGRAIKEQAENAVLMYAYSCPLGYELLTLRFRFLEELDRRIIASEHHNRRIRDIVPEHVY